MQSRRQSRRAGAAHRIALALSAMAILLAAGCAESDDTTTPADSTTPQAATKVRWDRPENQQAQAEAAGLKLEPSESLTVHYHVHLDVFVDGEAIEVPASLGINIGPNGTAPKHGAPGIAPVHTHDSSGVIHVEAPADVAFTLGQVFTLWGVQLSADRAGAHGPVVVFVNGERSSGDPNDLVLAGHQEIAVVIGSGDDVDVPSEYNFPEDL